MYYLYYLVYIAGFYSSNMDLENLLSYMVDGTERLNDSLSGEFYVIFWMVHLVQQKKAATLCFLIGITKS